MVGRCSASHSRTVLSALTGYEPLPVGAERHAGHRAGVAVSGCADGLAGGGVPQPHRPVGAAGDEACAVGAERHPLTQSVWPVSGWPTGWPVAASHSRTVWSLLPEASGARRG